MDTSKLAIQSEELISSTLSKFDFLVSKPKYDTDGCDLQILDNLIHPTRLLRVQSKGRHFERSTNVEISKKHVDDNYILFIYLIDNDKNDTLYIFFPEEIKQLHSNENNYKLYCSKKTFATKYHSNIFSKDKAKQLKLRLLASRIKEKTTVLIDSFCLENGIMSTLRAYKELYPERDLLTPRTLDIFKQILSCYDGRKLENKIINIYLFLTPHNFIKTEYYDSEELYVGENKIRIFEMHINGLVSFEIEDFLNRIIDSENIILTASDIKYLPLIKELKAQNRDIILVCEKLDNDLRSFGFNWGNIAYPIAFAMGLHPHEI